MVDHKKVNSPYNQRDILPSFLTIVYHNTLRLESNSEN